MSTTHLCIPYGVAFSLPHGGHVPPKAHRGGLDSSVGSFWAIEETCQTLASMVRIRQNFKGVFIQMCCNIFRRHI